MTMPGSDPPDVLVCNATGAPLWSPDRGDGTYRNPVLFADYSDPDAIRVGDDYWLTASSFNHAPGLPILHSRDLVNWALVNYALPRLAPAGHFALPRHGGGVWAPALRFHEGRYWIYYPDPDFGLYATTAARPTGRWSDPVLLKAGCGLIDPCPLWDDNGTGYLIHGWAKSRSGINNRLTLHRLRRDHLAVVDEGEVVIDGDGIAGWNTLEGPKLYKRNGYYYVFAPAGGVRDGYQAVFRSRSIRGPYESRIVLAQGRTAVNGPHQGAWVETPSGENWFLHFQERPGFGRVVHLQPVVWRDDWPNVGRCDGMGPGEPVTEFRKPLVPDRGNGRAVTAAAAPARFGVPELDWQWQANPQPGWLSIDGTAWRLACVPLPAAGTNLRHAGNLLLRKFAGPAFVATTHLTLEARTDGERAGLVVFGHDYAWLGLRREQGRVQLVCCACAGTDHPAAERALAVIDAAPSAVELRANVDATARFQFAYRVGDGKFCPVGPVFQARSGAWVGAKVGVFAAGMPQRAAVGPGCATVSRFICSAPAEA